MYNALTLVIHLLHIILHILCVLDATQLPVSSSIPITTASVVRYRTAPPVWGMPLAQLVILDMGLLLLVRVRPVRSLAAKLVLI